MPGPLTLGEIASRLGGRVAGNPGTMVRQVGSLERAAPDQISFFSGGRHRAALAATRAAAVIVGAADERRTALPRIVCDDPYAYFARVSQLFNAATRQAPGVHPAACVAPSARLGARVSIGAGCVVGEDAAIGDDTCLYPGVVVYPGCELGARVIVHSGAVIGADGFGLAKAAEGWIKIPQIGRVRIGDDVEIGANTTIDRGAMDDTIIERGVKLDNQIQIGHNVRVGEHTAMAGCVAVAGSADIGRDCTVGAAAVILGHLKLVDGVHVSAGTVISRSILKPGTYTGMYPFDTNESWARNTARVRHLAELDERLRAVERRAPAKRKAKAKGKGKKHA